MRVLKTGWSVILVLLDKAFELGVQLLVYLEKGSNDVKRRMRDELGVSELVLR